MFQDVRYACRALVRNRAYASATIVTLALGLGVNTAVATVVWSVLFRPLPIADSDRVVLVYPADPTVEHLRQPISYSKFQEWRRRNTVFEELAAIVPIALTLSTEGDRDGVAAAAVSDNFFHLLRARPAEGRLLDARDEHGTDGFVACVISAPFARRTFGTSESPINHTLEVPSPQLSQVRLTLLVVGVMPDGFERWRDRVDVWLPAEAPSLLDSRELSSPGYLSFEAVARLRPGITTLQARTAMESLDRGVERELEGVDSRPAPPLRVVTLRDDVVAANLQRTLWLFAAAALLVLVIAAANVSSLLLARAEARHAEVWIRRALGASAADVFRITFAETTVLAAGGAIVGVPLAYWSLGLLGALAPAGISGQAIRFGPAVATLIMLLTLATAAAIAGVQHVTMRRAPRESLLHSGSALTTRTSSRMLDATVIVEMAIAVVVVVCGGLLVRNFVRLQHTDPGFHSNAVLVLTCDVAYPRAADEVAADRDRHVAVLLGLTLERATAIAGVDAAALGKSAPLEGSPLQRVSIRHEDGSRFLNGDPRNFAKTPDLHRITPRYFEVLGIPLRAGRAFTGDDDQSRTPVVIVNETMAKLHWPGESALGKRVKYLNLLTASAPWAEVVGIVGDVHSASLHDPPRPELYTPMNQASVTDGLLKIFLKTRGAPLGVVLAARTAIGAVDARLRMRRIATLREIVDASLSEQQYQAELIALFALLALALASVGVYGLLNYAVARRAREMGIRIALGATSGNVAWLVLRRGAILVIPGLAAGIVVALATTRVMGSLLYGISTTDPVTFVFVPALMIALAVAAGLAPTRRAASVDPAITLREE